MSEVVAQFRQETKRRSEQQAAKPGEVPCDVCTETKLKALKSCLVCLTSYCDTHLKPHLTAGPLRRHQLIDAVENLQNRMCIKHDEPLKLFCKTDRTCVCMLCSVSEHKNHDIVHLNDEYERQKSGLKKTEADIQQKIQERQVKIQEIKHAIDLSKKAADRETEEGVQVFTALMESVQRSLNRLIEEIQDKQRRTEDQAGGFIKDLEQEISELKKRSTEVEKLSHSEDHLHFIQTLVSVKSAPAMKTWDQVSVCPPSYEGTVERTVSELEGELKEVLKTVQLKRVQQYAVDVTLDPDTAHPELIVSDDNKQVHHSGFKKDLPNNPQRFTRSRCVLGKQSFSSGRFYFEVQVRGKSGWTIGVCREMINRKVPVFMTPEAGIWTIGLRNGNEYSAYFFPAVSLVLKSRPQRVGVFVDYEEGLVFFYDVNTADLIYTYNSCCFTGKLLPFLHTGLSDGGRNAAPLIITPIKH